MQAFVSSYVYLNAFVRLCVSQRVVHEAYKLVTYLYLKHFIQRSKKKLLRCWGPDVGRAVYQDAEMLQETFSMLVSALFCHNEVHSPAAGSHLLWLPRRA